LAVRTCRKNSVAVLDGELDVEHVPSPRLQRGQPRGQFVPHLRQALGQRPDGQRLVLTRHHVLALRLKRKSPYGAGSPVLGFLVNTTPVPLRALRFPKTIACTTTAVPMPSSMPSMRR